jgi:membrane-associated phospholipid phosphatase
MKRQPSCEHCHAIMKTAAIFVAALALATSVRAADEPSKLTVARRAVVAEAKRYACDASSLARAPLHWKAPQWARFGEGVAAVGALYAVDRQLADASQRNRSSLTNNIADVVTPFGGRRAENISALLIIGGLASHDTNLRDAGRDSLEAEIIAGGIVTPLLKRAFGRARPIQEEGASSFHPGSSTHQSFPSGHATNAFAFATAIAAHYDSWVVPTIVYSIATGVAFSRVNDRAHFPSDVLAGALIGRGIAKGIVYRHQHGTTTWIVSPAMFDRRPGVMLQIAAR